MQASRNAHDRGGAVSSALTARSFIGGWIPSGGSFSRFLGHRYTRVIALRRCHHSITPLLSDHGDPISGEIGGRRGFRGSRFRHLTLCLHHERPEKNREQNRTK